MSTPSSTASNSALPSPATPLLIGDHPALDFLNSILSPAGFPIDFLETGSSLAIWMPAAKILPDRVAQSLATFTPEQKEVLAARVRELREYFRALLVKRQQAHEAGAVPLQDNDIGFLNDFLRAAPLVQQLCMEDGAIKLLALRDLSKPVSVIAEIATLCADLLANHPIEQVRKCENPACTMWFNDAKRGPKRRWCSMALCGNRAKVAAHRARLKNDA